MPGKGYSTFGMKPVITSRLQEATDKSYPGMFLPSTLIIIMNEIKKGYYSVASHKIKLDLSGRYNTITIRSDVKDWLVENHERLGEEYVIGFVAALVGAIIENISSKFIDDNFSIPFAVGFSMWILYIIFLPNLELTLSGVPG